MSLLGFKEQKCGVCGEPKNELRDGNEIILRCTCDWERGYHDRLKRTVHPDYWLKKITNWSPPAFKDGGRGRFKSLIKIQKATAMQRLYDFCFKIHGRDKGTGFKQYALYKSMERGRNLYIRGPNGSGRGLLTATIKIFTAMKNISTTPLPGDWSTFKSEIAQSDWNSREADIVKMSIIENYRNVKLLALENVKGESGGARKFRSSTLIDDMLTKRSMLQGSMVMTSSDFIRQIGDTVGDRLPEILTSENTSIIIMFSPKEADALLSALVSYMSSARLVVLQLKQSAKEGLSNQLADDKAVEAVEEVLYLEDAFPEVPAVTTEASLKFNKANSVTTSLALGKYSMESIKQAFAKFNVDKKENNLAYQERHQRVLVNAVKASKELGSRMEEKEMLETGKMMSLACRPLESVKACIAAATELREKMVSE